MAFENCKLEEYEERKYKIPHRSELREFGGGTIDRENDIRLHFYKNGPVMESSDEYSFVFDYKGVVMYPTLRKELKENDVSWYIVNPDGVVRDEKKLNALREAMKVYKHVGYKRFLTNRNEKGTVNIMF